MESGIRGDTAIVFPGMGPTRFQDVAKFMLVNSFARDLVAEAEDTLDYSLFERYREAEGDYNEFAQVAFFVNCMALAHWAQATLGVAPDVCTGPSFGGKAAAVYSGAISFRDAVWMTASIVRLMDDYFATEHQDVVTQSFARTPADSLKELLGELDEKGEWYDISCHVDDDFHMLTLRQNNLDWLLRRLRGIGGMPLYTMRPPMHSSAFGVLRQRAEAEIMGEIEFTDPATPVVSDHDGQLLTSAAEIREMLLNGFVRTVRWPTAIATLRRLGVRTLYISGQDSLFGRVGVTTRNFTVVPLNPRIALQHRRRTVA
jgi:[acyl-carrier-protein] S-malonyltransferase